MTTVLEEDLKLFDEFKFEIDNALANYFANSFPQFVPCEMTKKSETNLQLTAITGLIEVQKQTFQYVPVFSSTKFAAKAIPQLLVTKKPEVTYVVHKLDDVTEAYKFFRKVFLAAAKMSTVAETTETLHLLYNPFVFRDEPYPVSNLFKYLGQIVAEFKAQGLQSLLYEDPQPKAEKEGGDEEVE